MESAGMQEDHPKEVNDASNKGEQDESWTHKPKSRIHQGEIIEGKREKKTVQRLDLQMGKPKEKLKFESIGKGDKLGDIARVNHAIGKLKAPQLKPLHKILYDRPGAVSSLRKHIRLFNGFPFDIDSDPYNKKREKMTRLPKVQLKTICQILDLERSGNQGILVDRIIQFLINPTNSGKPVILKKKKKKKTTKDAKREKNTTSKNKKEQLESGKSKAIVTDSSSDEDEDEDEGETKNEGTEKSSLSDIQKKGDDDSNSEEEEKKNMYPDDEEESSKSKKQSSKKKPTPKKAVKKAEDTFDQSLSDGDSDEDTNFKKTKNKPVALKKVLAKPVPKTKKADSNSNRKKNTVRKSQVKSESSDDDDDDDDDEPLIKMIKKPPTNEQLKGAVGDLLKDANLGEVTMKQICQQVYDLYPEFDLTDRKDFIKQTVKSLIS
ncbi:hypothetical protein P4O66_010168 [Electrophorus voltai]|uniref:Protein DEK n=1 Tax=Electrophorus voltai TaxID=2609070 RepID=A0AAD8Z9J5_9TELE|nr:hypothetical protein P4O66_010168 [Electrophorus voltai]